MMLLRRTSPMISIASILMSISFMALGSGLMFAYIPFTLTRLGYPAWIAGAAVTAIAAGGILGCLLAGPLIRRVGHARIFACFAALSIFSVALIATGVWPAGWLTARFIYGMASNGIFIVAQSWLNHSSDNSWRGRAMSVFYMVYVIGIGVGSFLFGQLSDDGRMAPLISIMFSTMGILPIGLTRLDTPPPPEKVHIDIRATWKTSPVALIGILASGGLSMLVQGFTPIYAVTNGMGQSQIAMLMFLMQLGMLAVQLPLGALSDRIDRRIVLMGAFLLVAVMAFAAAAIPFTGLVLVAVIFALWSGATETIYSVSNAHANDRAKPEDFVTLASTMLVAWSASAFVLPAIVTAVTPIFGPRAFMYAAIAVSLPTAAFILVRLSQRLAVPDHDAENFELRSAQMPNVEVLVNPEENEPELDLKR
jgi:MFS family permease